ncbi:MAG: class II SORL domain-containing protein [Deferribacteraceae bacterium]|jgi:superoxide reductase|nr:class II SORL domain-containing protein [Deferribacteraceae bacterium]
MSISELTKTADFKSEKHVPVITVDQAKEGLYNISVSVGKEISHPNTTEHFIAWISLYLKTDDGKVFELGKVDFSAHGQSADSAAKGSVVTEPAAIFTVKLQAGGKLTALSYCNIHGLWESSANIS